MITTPGFFFSRGHTMNRRTDRLHPDPVTDRMLRQMRNNWLRANAANTARALQRAPSPPRTPPRPRTPAPRAPPRMNLNTRLRLLHLAAVERKRRRAQEEAELQLRLLALRMPSVPRTTPRLRR